MKHPAAKGCTDDGTLAIVPIYIYPSWTDILAYSTDRITDVTYNATQEVSHGRSDLCIAMVHDQKNCLDAVHTIINGAYATLDKGQTICWPYPQ
jgi:hypothetical protein